MDMGCFSRVSDVISCKTVNTKRRGRFKETKGAVKSYDTEAARRGKGRGGGIIASGKGEEERNFIC